MRKTHIQRDRDAKTEMVRAECGRLVQWHACTSEPSRSDKELCKQCYRQEYGITTAEADRRMTGAMKALKSAKLRTQAARTMQQLAPFCSPKVGERAHKEFKRIMSKAYPSVFGTNGGDRMTTKTDGGKDRKEQIEAAIERIEELVVGAIDPSFVDYYNEGV